MNKTLILTTSPTVNGNGDALAAALERNAGVATRMNMREMSIAPFSFGQPQDDFSKILDEARNTDGIAVVTPIYFNIPCAQAVTLLNRFFCVFQPEYTKSGKAKKLAVLATCGNGDPEKIKSVIEEATCFFEMEKRIEIFNLVQKPEDMSDDYLKRAEQIGKWLVE